MKQIAIIFLIILGSIISSVYLRHDPGYVLFLFHGWQIQTSLVVFVIGLIGILILSILIAKVVLIILQSPLYIFKLFNYWREQIKKRYLNQGIQAFYQGQWALSLKKLKTQGSQAPWMIDLIAAQAAQEENQLRERDHFLSLANLNEPKMQNTILLFQAKLQVEKEQFKQAKTALNQIAQHTNTLPIEWYWIQLKIYQEMNQYAQGFQLLNNHNFLQKDVKQFTKYYLFFASRILQQFLKEKKYKDSYALFKSSPKYLKNNLTLFNPLAHTLYFIKEFQKPIQKHIQQLLVTKPEDKELLDLISQLPYDAKSFKILEKNSVDYPNNADILLSLGQIKASQKLWGAAIYDIQKSIELKPSAKAWSFLAKIYLDLQQTTNALNAMQEALKIEKIYN